MPQFSSRLALPLSSILLLGLLVTVPGARLAQAQTAPLRVAIVGLEHGHVDGLFDALPRNKNVELVGIADPDPALEAKYEKRYSLPPSLFFPRTEEMIEARHPQALLVYTSVGGHRKVIETAARYGVSVMVEKPLTISLDDALAIRKIAKEHHIHVLVNYETTWYASNHAAYDEAEEGKLGAIRRVVINDGHEGPAEIGVSPEFLKWLTDPVQNGAGALYDFGCYGVDLMTWLMHGETPLSVTAVVNHDKPLIYPHVDDDATIVLAYPHAQAVIQASWNWPFSRKDMAIYGATGYAITVGSKRLRLRLHGDAEEQVKTAAPLEGADSNSLNYLYAVLTASTRPEEDAQMPDHAGSGRPALTKGGLSSLDTNVLVVQILDAARESARTGKTIRLRKLEE